MVRLQVTNGQNQDEAIVYVQSEASNGFDVYDSPKMSNNNPAVPEIYTFAGKEKVAINGLQRLEDKIKLGFKTETKDSFAIKVVDAFLVDAATRIILKDSLLNRIQDLTDGMEYCFESGATVDENRFALIIQSTTDINEPIKATAKQCVSVYRNTANRIVINRKYMNKPGIVTILNTLGQKLEQVAITGENIQIEKNLNPGVYLLILEESGETTTQKFVL